MENKCNHRFVFNGNCGSGLTLMFRCKLCDYRTERRTTMAEYKAIAEEGRTWLKPLEINRLAHSFSRRFQNSDRTFKISGYKLMQAAEKFAKQNPSCQLLLCDDDTSCTSYVLVIPHEDEKEYYGTTFVTIPQYGTPSCIFFNPRETQVVGVVFNNLFKRFRQKEPIRRRHEREKNKKFMSNGFQFKPREPLLTDGFVKRRERQIEIMRKKLPKKIKKMCGY